MQARLSAARTAGCKWLAEYMHRDSLLYSTLFHSSPLLLHSPLPLPCCDSPAIAAPIRRAALGSRISRRGEQERDLGANTDPEKSISDTPPAPRFSVQMLCPIFPSRTRNPSLGAGSSSGGDGGNGGRTVWEHPGISVNVIRRAGRRGKVGVKNARDLLAVLVEAELMIDSRVSQRVPQPRRKGKVT